jgi:hypothetical protein
MPNKIIRSICLFTEASGKSDEQTLKDISTLLARAAYQVQTLRIVTKEKNIRQLDSLWHDKNIFTGVGTLDRKESFAQLDDFLDAGNLSFNLEILDHVTSEDVGLLFEIIKSKPEKTFNFSYTFNNAVSSPFFPAAHFQQTGFSIGLQPTDLAEGCGSLHTWLFRMKESWEEIVALMARDEHFLGIDSSVAPMYEADGSLIHLMKRIHGTFCRSVTSESYVNISRFIKAENPKPVGLNGLMFPCLEDFELADEYENGEFSIERNIFLSLHSGLGIDTYPIGIDEDPGRIRQILNLLLALAQKYNKPLSARFVSDGKTRIGKRSDFRNIYLKDVVIRAL